MNLNKKTIIQLVIIVAAFIAAGIVLYNGFFSNKGPASSPTALSGPASSQAPQEILPYGESGFDFSVLSNRPFVFSQIQYPKLDPNSEVGVLPSSMIASPVSGH